MSDAVFLTPPELVERWRGTVTIGTLAVWRSTGKGPPFTKMGHRVLYPLDTLQQYEKTRQKGEKSDEFSKSSDSQGTP